MTGTRIYLDYNATAPLRSEAGEAMRRAIEAAEKASGTGLGNPSSVHGEGRKARALVEEARRDVAALLSAPAEGVIFTGSGTEAVNLAAAQAEALGCSAVLYGASEHACGIGAAEASPLESRPIPLLANGLVDLDALGALLKEAGEKPFVLLQHANNETGVVQPLEEAARLVRGAGGILASDLVQSAGKTAIDIKALGIHMGAISAHKMGGPQGVGALVLAEDMPLTPLLHGGGQERRRRGGTENVIGIAGFAAAAKAALNDMESLEDQRALRDAFEAKLKDYAPGVVIFGESAPRLANTSCFALADADVSAEMLLMKLDLAGFAVSSGAACSSGKVAASHVLSAMQVEDRLSRSAIRMSFGRESTLEEVLALADTWAGAAVKHDAPAPGAVMAS